MKKDLARLRELQSRLAKEIVLLDKFKNSEQVAGADQAFIGHKIISAIVVCDRTGHVADKSYAIARETFPYVPGYLSFREGPPILKAWAKLKTKPDILLIGGHGIAHPRGLGLASWVGLKLKRPTIGVAKNPLCGKIIREKIYINGNVKGFALKTNSKPIYISPGHMISLNTSLRIVKACTKTKLPEPLWLAHLYANEIKGKICG